MCGLRSCRPHPPHIVIPSVTECNCVREYRSTRARSTTEYPPPIRRSPQAARGLVSLAGWYPLHALAKHRSRRDLDKLLLLRCPLSLAGDCVRLHVHGIMCHPQSPPMLRSAHVAWHLPACSQYLLGCSQCPCAQPSSKMVAPIAALSEKRGTGVRHGGVRRGGVRCGGMRRGGVRRGDAPSHRARPLTCDMARRHSHPPPLGRSILIRLASDVA